MSTLYTEVSGTGPDLVLLHGWALNLRVWDSLAEELRPHFRLIAVDLPGHGRSRWSTGRCTPAEQAWLVHQTLEPISDRYSLLGWSLGGQIALDLAAATPAQIDKLILVATTAKFAASEDWPHGTGAAEIDALAGKLRTDYERTVSDFLELQVRTSLVGQGLLAQLRASLFAHGAAQPEALQCGLDILAANDLRPSLQHVQARTLVVAGEHDRITPPAASRSLAQSLPSARYVEFARAAHAPFLSHRTEFAALVRRFLRTATGARKPVKARKRTGVKSRPIKHKRVSSGTRPQRKSKRARNSPLPTRRKAVRLKSRTPPRRPAKRARRKK